MGEQLTPIEKNNLVELEATITKNLTAFYEVGFALMQIRDNKLYRETHSTFEEYCRERWNFTANYARRLIASSEVVDNIKNVPIGTIPQSEAQTRPLAKLKDPDQQREVYQKAVETAPEGKVTAKHIEETVRELREGGKNNSDIEDVSTRKESKNLSELKFYWGKSSSVDRKKFRRWLRTQRD